MDRDRCLVLFFAANPEGTTALRLDEEIREIEAKIRAAEHRDRIELKSCWAVRPDDLLQALNEHDPDIVHFSGYGTASAEIILTGPLGRPQPVSQEALKLLFSVMQEKLKAVVLNACFSESQALAISSSVDVTIGMNKPIGDAAAIVFASSFYRALAFGKSFETAFHQGQVALQLQGLADFDVPVLNSRKGVNPSKIFLVEEIEGKDLTALAVALSAPTKRFFGRRQEHLRQLLTGSLIFRVAGDKKQRQQLSSSSDLSGKMKKAIIGYKKQLAEEVTQLSELRQLFEENGQRWERLLEKQVLVQINKILLLITNTKNVVVKLSDFVESVESEMNKELYGKKGRQKRLDIVFKHTDLIGRASEQLFQTLLLYSSLIGNAYNKLVTLVPESLVERNLMSQIEWSFSMKEGQPKVAHVRILEPT